MCKSSNCHPKCTHTHRKRSEKDQGPDETSILIQGKSKESIVGAYQTEGSFHDTTAKIDGVDPKMGMILQDHVRGLEPMEAS